MRNSLLLGQKILFKREVQVKCSSVLGGKHLSDVIFDEFDCMCPVKYARRCCLFRNVVGTMMKAGVH